MVFLAVVVLRLHHSVVRMAKHRRHLRPKSPSSPASDFHLETARLNTPTSITTVTSPVMCGIFCSLDCSGYITPDANIQQLLQNRGPDRVGRHQTVIKPLQVNEDEALSQVYATFLSTVLSLRGSTVVAQPLIDEATGSVLCWNGEAWSIHDDVVTGNDSNVVFAQLLGACAGSPDAATRAVIRFISSIRGPYAFVFYDAVQRRLYYGRDCLGRRSLLRKSMPDGTLILSSVCDSASGAAWLEVEADGIYIVNLHRETPNSPPLSLEHIPHSASNQEEGQTLSFVGKSSGPRILLTSKDSTFSYDEPHIFRATP